MDRLQQDVFKAQDNLLKAKVSQATHANITCNPNLELDIGDHMMLLTENQRCQYAAKGEKCVAKFMPRFDGPYPIIDINHEASTVMLDLPTASNMYPTFHTKEVKPYNENDQCLFPS